MAFRWSALQSSILPTLAEYKRAYKAAESEKPDPRMLLAAIARVPEANSRVGGLIQSVRDSVMGFPWEIEPADRKNERAVRLAVEMNERFLASGIADNLDVIADAKFFGLTGLRLAWQSGPAWTARAEVIPSTELYWEKYPDGFFGPSLIQDEPTFSTQLIAEEDRAKFIFAYYNPFKSTRPGFIGGVLRGALPLVIIKNQNWASWAKFCEKFIQPFRVAQYDPATSEEDKAIARKALEEFGENAWALISKDVMFQFIEAVKSGTVSAYESLKESIDKELAVLIKGEANTSELPNQGGSRAAVQVMKLIADDAMFRMIQDIQRIINQQYIAVDYRLNVSETDMTLRPRFRFVTDESEDREANARIVTELTANGYELDDEEVSRKTGFTARKNTVTPNG